MNTRLPQAERIGEGTPNKSLFLLLLILIASQVHCGYRVASRNRLSPDIGTIAVLPLENETTTFEVEQILTQALVRALVEGSNYGVTTRPTGGDAILKGVVFRASADPVLFGQETFGSTFQVTLNVRVELSERETGKIIFKNDNYTFREQYVINADVTNFFSELNPALRRIADDFASSVVATVIERF